LRDDICPRFHHTSANPTFLVLDSCHTRPRIALVDLSLNIPMQV